MAEDGLDDTKALAVDVTARGGVDLLLHQLNEAGYVSVCLLNPPKENIHLASGFRFGIPKAFQAQGAGAAVAQVSLEKLGTLPRFLNACQDQAR